MKSESGSGNRKRDDQRNSVTHVQESRDLKCNMGTIVIILYGGKLLRIL